MHIVWSIYDQSNEITYKQMYKQISWDRIKEFSSNDEIQLIHGFLYQRFSSLIWSNFIYDFC